MPPRTPPALPAGERVEPPLPVLIIPGFMSSGLEVKETPTRGYTGKRVWINLTSLGFDSIHRGSALHRNESMREMGSPDYSEERHAEYERQNKCKSDWLQHISLRDDMCTERRGIKVRAIEGLKGVDYLTPGALTNHLSYVFGPVIQALQGVGYTDNNLDAAPYDWRLPPSELEVRDGYFSKTMRRIEEMYEQNDDTPVVLICHSLGCKTGHYFLNFALDHPTGGKKWLQKYVHTYLPVGAPHLGAPKSIRALVDGDKMGLDTFLSDEEGLILGRSLGSGPWLAPRVLPEKVPPLVYIRREGVLEVTVKPIDCTSLLRERADKPPKLRLVVTFEKEVLVSSFTAPKKNPKGHLLVEFPGTFTLPAKARRTAGENHRSGDVQFLLQEPGLTKESQKEKRKLWLPLRCIKAIICCPIKYFLCLPCTLLKCVLVVLWKVSVKSADLVAKAAGAGTNVAWCKPFDLSDALPSKNKDEGTAKATLWHGLNDKGDGFRRPRSAVIHANFKWLPPKDYPAEEARRVTPVGVLTQSSVTEAAIVRHHMKKLVHYEATDGCELLLREGMDKTLEFVKDRYETGDDRGPRTRSAAKAPPVGRVYAVYGVNLPTEVGAIYRRRSILVEGAHRVQKLHKLDGSARIKTREGLSVKGGVILETPYTSKEETDKNGDVVKQKSGDGTVPYWSMRHCKTWQSQECRVETVEIDKAEHREILADSRFHKVIIDYVTRKKEVDPQKFLDFKG